MTCLSQRGAIATVALGALVATLPDEARSQPRVPVSEYTNPRAPVVLPPSALALDLGGPNGTVEFHRIVDILPQRDGTFIVVNGGTNELRFFDAVGHLRSTVGRQGSGPGEYSRIREAALLPGDSIAIFDASSRRISLLDAQGAFVSSFSVAQAPFEGGGTPTRLIAMASGTLLVGFSEIVRMPPQPAPAYFGQRFFPYSTNGELRSHDALLLKDSEHFVQAAPPTMGGVAYWNLAFGRTVTIAPDSAGFLLTGDGTDWSVDRRTAAGVLVRTYRLKRPVDRVTAHDKEAFAAAALLGSRSGQRALAEKMVAEMPYPRTKPAYRRFDTDGAGRIWLEVYPSSEDAPPLWIRIDRGTRMARALQLPARFQPLAFTATRMYGVWRDNDDVEHVQVFDLERR